MIRIAAQHEKHGLVIGTLDVITLPDYAGSMFVLKVGAVFTTDKQTIQNYTLSGLVAEAERQGLSGIEPIIELPDHRPISIMGRRKE